MDNSQPDYFIVAVILTAVVYMFFPIIKIITNHGNLFERKRAKRIALWNSVVVGAVFCLLTSALIGPWSAAPAFIYFWINSAILTDKSKKEGSDAVQAKEDNIENVGKPTSDETVVGNAIQSENTANINPVKQETNDQPYVKPYNTESIIQPLVSEISDTANKKPGKPKYCSRCGQLIDRKTKKCTGCGRRYVPIKPIVASIAAVVLMGGIVCFFCFAVPEIRYQQAISYYKQGEYDKANALLQHDLDYKDSRKYLHTHILTTIETVDATCDTDGYKTKKWACGKTVKEVIKSHHTFSEATCTAPKTCQICGMTSGDALGHSYGTFCTRCGERLFKTQVYSGTDSDTISNINLPNGDFKITIEYDGNENFSAGGMDGTVYFRTTSSTTRSFDVISVGYNENKRIVIMCDGGSWTVTIEAIK